MEKSNGFYYLVYMSAATELPRAAELEDILIVARRNNGSLDVTGMLLYGEGTFIQLLEGEEQRIRDLYDKIGRDSRHSRLMTMLEGTEATRHFPDWSMGFRAVNRDEIAQVPGYTEFMSSKASVAALWKESRNAYKLLSYFRDHN